MLPNSTERDDPSALFSSGRLKVDRKNALIVLDRTLTMCGYAERFLREVVDRW